MPFTPVPPPGPSDWITDSWIAQFIVANFSALWPFSVKGDIPMATDAYNLTPVHMSTKWKIMRALPLESTPAAWQEDLSTRLNFSVKIVPNNTLTTLDTGDASAIWDSLASFNMSFRDRLTVPSGCSHAPLFDISFTGYFASVYGSGGLCQVELLRNGSAMTGQTLNADTNGNAIWVNLTWQERLAATDYIQVRLNQQTGVSVSFYSGILVLALHN